MKPSATYVDHFTVVSATGALLDGDSTPTAAAYKNGSVDGAISVTVTKISTGSYVASFTVGSGYVSGDKVSAFATCAVGGVTVGVWLRTVEIDSAFVSEVLTDTNAMHTHIQTLLDGVVLAATQSLYAPTKVSDLPTVGAIADALCEELLSGHATAGSVAKALSDLLTILATVHSELEELDGDVEGIITNGVLADVRKVNGVAASVQTDLAKTTDLAGIPASVWGYGTKVLTGFGTLVADIRASVWGGTDRTLTSFGTLVADIRASIWSGVRRLTTALGVEYDPPTAAQNADGLLDRAMAGHSTPGSVAEYLVNTQSTSSGNSTKLDTLGTTAGRIESNMADGADVMNIRNDIAGVGGDVTLAAEQPHYAPAKPGDAMNLTEAYDAAKDAASGSDMQALTAGILVGTIVSPNLRPIVVICTDSISGAALPGCLAWVSTSKSGADKISTALSGDDGRAVLWVSSAGKYYVFRKMYGKMFVPNPLEVTVT